MPEAADDRTHPVGRLEYISRSSSTVVVLEAVAGRAAGGELLIGCTIETERDRNDVTHIQPQQ